MVLQALSPLSKLRRLPAPAPHLNNTTFLNAFTSRRVVAYSPACFGLLSSVRWQHYVQIVRRDVVVLVCAWRVGSSLQMVGKTMALW